jgi:TRAP-type C4-dicarboxylate transport system substrate-binding protein
MRKLSKFLGLLLVVILASSILLGCTAEEEPSPVVPTPGEPTEPEEPVEAIHWRVNHLSQPVQVYGNGTVEWIPADIVAKVEAAIGHPMVLPQEFRAEVGRRSGGRLILQAHLNNELGFPASEYLPMIKEGYVEMSGCPWFVMAEHAQELLYQGISGWMPPTDLDARECMIRNRAVMVKYAIEPLGEKWGFIGLTSNGTAGGAHMGSSISIKEPAPDFESLAGRKIRAAGIGPSLVYRAMGMVPVNLPRPEVYMAMKTGLLDAAGGFSSLKRQSLSDMCDYTVWFYPTGVGSATHGIMASKIHWDKLPPDLQQIVRQAAKEQEATFLELENYDWESKTDLDWMIEHEITVYNLDHDTWMYRYLEKFGAGKVELIDWPGGWAANFPRLRRGNHQAINDYLNTTTDEGREIYKQAVMALDYPVEYYNALLEGDYATADSYERPKLGAYGRILESFGARFLE